jgi:hypothetical protein
MRLRRLRLAAFVALPVVMFLAGFAGAGSRFVPYPKASRPLRCNSVNDCGCKNNWPRHGESTWVLSGTYKLPTATVITSTQLGAWQCGSTAAGIDGEIWLTSCMGYPTVPQGTVFGGNAYFELSGCN